LKVQFDAISGRIAEKYLTLSGQRHVVNLMFNSMSLQLRGSGRKIRAREGDVVECRTAVFATIFIR
jgi:hypothetical protein